jgi:hypothetical protein
MPLTSDKANDRLRLLFRSGNAAGKITLVEHAGSYTSNPFLYCVEVGEGKLRANSSSGNGISCECFMVEEVIQIQLVASCCRLITTVRSTFREFLPPPQRPMSVTATASSFTLSASP